jgi:microcystin-dependent protein
MSDQYLGEIRIFGGNFAPLGWALCNGQLMSISQNTALFSLLGVNYGGNGTTTFGLPNLTGSAPVDQGQGAGLSPRVLGEASGVTSVTLGTQEMPSHTHPVNVVAGLGNSNTPANNVWAEAGIGRAVENIYSPAAPNALMNPQATAAAGNGQPHNNMPPYLCLNFIIALEGIFPPRS